MCNKTEVAVGLSISLTGRFRPQGQQALQGIRLWQSYINAQGGIAVRKGEKRFVRLIWYDDRSQISFAWKNVFQLLREDKIDILLGPYSSSLTMAVVEIAEEYKKVLWNYGGSSDEIFSLGRRYLVGIASPASEYPRALPHWLAEESPALGRICVLYSGRGTFGWRFARGVLESALGVAHHSVHLVPINVPWDFSIDRWRGLCGAVVQVETKLELSCVRHEAGMPWRIEHDFNMNFLDTGQLRELVLYVAFEHVAHTAPGSRHGHLDTNSVPT
jgi:hypothetical protein